MENGETVLDINFGVGRVDDRFNEIGGIFLFSGAEAEILEENDFYVGGDIKGLFFGEGVKTDFLFGEEFPKGVGDGRKGIIEIRLTFRATEVGN